MAAALMAPRVINAQEQHASSIEVALRRTVGGVDLPGGPATDVARYRAPLAHLYGEARWQLIWTAADRPTEQADAVIANMAAAATRGLRARDYDAEALRTRAALIADGSLVRSEDLASFDVWLSLSVMRFISHLHHGRAYPFTVLFAPPGDATQLDDARQTLLVSRAADVDAALAAVEPPFARYAALKAALARYRQLAADTSLRPPPLSARPIQPGDRYAVASLRRLLIRLGDLGADTPAPASASADTLYEDGLVEAVQRFQRRHGLTPDGILGPATLAQLRAPLASRVRQIELTLERWRWLPAQPARRFAVINIPGFRLYLFDRDSQEDRPVAKMDVIVGQAYPRRQTPIFVGTMRTLIFWPYWDVPRSIARNELIPTIQRHPEAFAREGFEIVRSHGDGAGRYAPTDENLARVAAGTLRMRQRPGPRNALGPIKFIFPNAYNVYLHGTPQQELFAHPRRDFSHGCIRVSDPTALAEFVLDGENEWDPPAIQAAMRSGHTLEVRLVRPLPIYVLYATAVPGDDEGEVYFYPDLYGRDAALARTLGEE
jgi:murein L,D-transpeptidase YcbB/YkuD